MRDINRRFYLRPRMVARRLARDLGSPAELWLDLRQVWSILTAGGSMQRAFADYKE